MYMAQTEKQEVFKTQKIHERYPTSNVTIGSKSKEQLDKENEKKLEAIIRQDGYFGLDGSVLIIRGWEVVEPIIKRDQKRMETFNQKLKDLGVGFWISAVHRTYVGKMIYMYSGKYIFEGNGRAKRYKMKFSPESWRNLLKPSHFKDVGGVPRLELPDLRFQRVMSFGENTRNIIIPNNLFINQKVRKIFHGCTVYKISG